MTNDTARAVLIAEDDPDDSFLIREAWEQVAPRRQIQFVQDGEELMKRLREAGGDAAIILLDLNMPRKDGRQALREIKADPRLSRIPVVAFSTSRSLNDVALVYDLGASSYIVKPPSFERLLDIVRAVEKYWFDAVQLPPPAG